MTLDKTTNVGLLLPIGADSLRQLSHQVPIAADSCRHTRPKTAPVGTYRRLSAPIGAKTTFSQIHGVPSSFWCLEFLWCLELGVWDFASLPRAQPNWFEPVRAGRNRFELQTALPFTCVHLRSLKFTYFSAPAPRDRHSAPALITNRDLSDLIGT